MSNINRDLKIELTLGEYMDLVTKANLLDECKNASLSLVQAKLIPSIFHEGEFEAVIEVGVGDLFLEERRQKLFELIANKTDVVQWLHHKGKHYYYISGDYVTDYSCGEEYFDLLTIPEFKRQWDELELTRNVAEAIEEVADDEE